MSKNTYRMIGLISMMISVFFIIGGLFLKGESIPPSLAPICLVVGIVLLVIGTVFYKVLKSD